MVRRQYSHLQIGRAFAKFEGANDSLRDRWFSAEEARDYGIIDHIVERLDDVRPASTSKTAGL